jgi:hypothetical protein
LPMSYPPPCAQCRGASARCQVPGAHVPCGNGDLDLGSGCGCGSEPRCGWWLVREINKQAALVVLILFFAGEADINAPLRPFWGPKSLPGRGAEARSHPEPNRQSSTSANKRAPTPPPPPLCFVFALAARPPPRQKKLRVLRLRLLGVRGLWVEMAEDLDEKSAN